MGTPGGRQQLGKAGARQIAAPWSPRVTVEQQLHHLDVTSPFELNQGSAAVLYALVAKGGD